MHRLPFPRPVGERPRLDLRVVEVAGIDLGRSGILGVVMGVIVAVRRLAFGNRRERGQRDAAQRRDERQGAEARVQGRGGAWIGLQLM